MATKTLATSGAWDTAANWSPASVPTTTDDVVIPEGKMPTSGPASAVTIASLSVSCQNNYASLNLYNLTVTGNSTFEGITGAGGNLTIVGGTYNGNVTVSGSVDFSQLAGSGRPDYAQWGNSTAMTVSSGSTVIVALPPPTVSAPAATVFIMGAADGYQDGTWNSNVTANVAILPASANRDWAGQSLDITVNCFACLDGGYFDFTNNTTLTLNSAAKGYYVGQSAQGITIVDNRTSTGVSPADIAAAVVAANPQLNQNQLINAFQLAAFGTTGKTMAINGDGSMSCKVVGYDLASYPQAVLGGAYTDTMGTDGNGNLTLTGPKPMFFLLPNGTVVTE